MLSYLRASPGDGEADERALNLEAALAVETTDFTDSYCTLCQSLQVTPHSGVLAFIRLRLAELRPLEKEGFADRDMFAFCDFMLRESGSAKAIFDHWTRVDLERCAIGPAGCRMLARVLRLPGCRVHTINISRQQIGTAGTSALVRSVRDNTTISRLDMKLCFVNDSGAAELLEMIRDGDGATGLTELDMSNNMLTFPMCQQLLVARPEGLTLVLKGNRVLDEVLNASSHFFGLVLVIIGAIFMGVEAAEQNHAWELLHHGEAYHGLVVDRGPYTTSVVIYLVSLAVLYLSSTLYHATFAMGDAVVNIFTILDHSAIYLLIAGTYTPFLAIIFPDKTVYSVGLLGFLWAMAFTGIALAAFYNGPFKIGMMIGSYVGMGWACVICSREMVARMMPQPMGLILLLAGGVFYTAGVPFNVRDKRTCGFPDHTIWHFFVIGGSMCHFYAIFYYLLPFPYEGDADSAVI